MQLYAADLGRPRAVMRNGSDVLNGLDGHSRCLQGGDRAFAAGTGAFNPNLKFLHAELGGPLGRLLPGALAGKGRALAAALESAGACAGPAERVALGVGDRDDGVVERRLDVGNRSSRCDGFSFSWWLLLQQE